MKKAVMKSVPPRQCEKVANGECTILLSKTKPKLETPFKCYIYCTKSKEVMFTVFLNEPEREVEYLSGKVIGEFVCDKIDEFHEWQLTPQGYFQEFEETDLKRFLSESCLSWEEVYAYRQNLPYYKPLYGWHISDLKIYDKPKELGEFRISRHCKEKDCETCKRKRGEYLCDKRLTRPFQSWGYVEEVDNE